MNARSIKELRRRMITVSMISFVLVMLFAGICINVANINQVRANAKDTLDYIVENDGELPDPANSTSFKFGETDSTAEGSEENASAASASSDASGSTDSSAADQDGYLERHENFTKEFRYTTRYFAVLYDADGNIDRINTNHIVSITEEQAKDYSEFVEKLNENKWSFSRLFSSGFGKYGDFYYEIGTMSNGCQIIAFLDSSTQLSISNKVISQTVIICGSGLLVTFFLVYIFSSRMIQPEIENARRQKQFITNASHELKTPLAVIRANTEIEEMMHGEDEWTQSTMRQVDRLNGLIQNLVMITKAQEKEDKSVLAEIDVSKMVEESIDPYESLSQQEKKALVRKITPDLKMVADESKIRQLTTILIDNAFKYCDDDGTITVALDQTGRRKTARLVVSNNYADGATVDYQKFFDRFYREDQAHTQDKGGYGIGLSIAESICHSYNGSITASWKDGIIYFTCLLN
ncbi:MAG: HAMP domain-containing sensor histidine kinase [Lachnospiraceae bacterium]|nr:HAMP domain-containing sensor histidine kinase [Lachnospiraceae bacterium]